MKAELAQRIADGDPELEDRIAVLATRANEGELTAEERAEYCTRFTDNTSARSDHHPGPLAVVLESIV